MFPQTGEYFVDVSCMFVRIPRKNKYVIQINHYEFVEGLEKMLFMKCWKVAGAFVRLKCMTMKSKEP